MNLKEFLERAKNLLETQGWTQGQMMRRHPQGGYTYCAMGALDQTSLQLAYYGEIGSSHLIIEAIEALQDHLPDVGWTQNRTVHTFNDHRNTTKEDVLALFDKAIADQP